MRVDASIKICYATKLLKLDKKEALNEMEIFIVILGVVMISFSIGFIALALETIISRGKEHHYNRLREGFKEENRNRKEEK